jgi:hypothetical protein
MQGLRLSLGFIANADEVIMTFTHKQCREPDSQ